MRRVTVEVPLADIIGPDSRSELWQIESLEIVQLLRQEKGKLDGIFRIALKNPNMKIEKAFPNIAEIQLLNEDRKSQVRTYYIKYRWHHSSRRLFSLSGKSGGYVSTPFEVKDEKVRMNFLGSSKEVTSFLKRIERLWPHYKIVSLVDAKFSPSSPISRLTEKQRRALLTAFDLGYYDLPRRVSSEEIAKKLDLVSSTFISHRRKAERRILTEIINS